MKTRTAPRAASAAALTLTAMLALSACGGDDDAKAGSQGEGVGDNAQAQGVYVAPGSAGTGEEILVIHGKDIALIQYGGETCDDFTAFFDAAKAGEFEAFDNEGDNPDHLGTIDQGTLNDTQTKMIFPADTGYDPKPVSVNNPDTGYITVGNDGDYYIPKDSDEGKAKVDDWKTAQCG